MSFGLNPHLGRCNQLPAANWMCLLSFPSSNSVCHQYFCLITLFFLSRPTNAFVLHLQISRNLFSFVLPFLFPSPWLLPRMNSSCFTLLSEVICLFVFHLCDEFLWPNPCWPLGSSAAQLCCSGPAEHSWIPWVTLEVSYLCLCISASFSKQPSAFIGSLSIFHSWPSVFLHLSLTLPVPCAQWPLFSLSDLPLSALVCWQCQVGLLPWASLSSEVVFGWKIEIFPCQCIETWPGEVLLEKPAHPNDWTPHFEENRENICARPMFGLNDLEAFSNPHDSMILQVFL